ncbi:MAG: hypothetical protein VX498_10420 [Myxococcota bacterium]|nr:hypothetical protein [Myxococcota bacterium]
MRFTFVLFLLSLMVACGDPGPGDGLPHGDDDDTEGQWIEPPDGPSLRIETPEMTLPPGEEVFWCYFGTFPEDLSVNRMRVQTTSPFLHHTLLKEVPPEIEGYPDGEMVPCEPLGEWWASSPTMFETAGGTADYLFNLPEGVAFQIREGQRYVVDSHYLNLTDEALVGKVVYDLHLVDPEDVEYVAGTFNHDIGDLNIPTGGLTTLFGDCSWDHQVTILNMGPHMHAHGAQYAVDWLRPDEEAERILFVEDWLPEYREEPPLIDFAPGELVVEAGEVFRTWCTWDNETEDPLTFPEEMCTTFGVAYPLEENWFCDALPPDEGKGPPEGG